MQRALVCSADGFIGRRAPVYYVKDIADALTRVAKRFPGGVGEFDVFYL